MAGADGITAHFLQHLQLVTYGTPVYGSPKGTEVVVQANTLELTSLTVEEEPTVGHQFNASDAKPCLVGVNRVITHHQCRNSLVKHRAFGAPKLGGVDEEVLFQRLAV